MKYKWRGGRVVEGARLESVKRGNSFMGSNPILSATNNLYFMRSISHFLQIGKIIKRAI